MSMSSYIRANRYRANLNSSDPLPTRALSTREQIILLEGSKLNGFVFPPWNSPPAAPEFELVAGEPPYLENVELRLSKIQQKVFNGWQRPNKAFPIPNLQQPDIFPESGRPTMTSHGTIDLVQDITTDCSVVASLCAGTAREQRGQSKILSTIMFPYDYHSMKPKISPNGKYVFRLHFNGCFRKVVIDDRLPTSSSEQTLHVTDRGNPGLLWPALIEKAYLKVRGGYDFPGSNSGTDLWVMTGWVPEQLFLQRDDTSPNAMWRRVFTAFNYGDVLVTLGTGKLTQLEEQNLGLIGEHDYAVIDMRESKGRRLFLVKNPWSEGTTWKGGIADRPLEPEPGSDDPSNQMCLAPGTFWMDFNDIFQSFESIYLNWNPNLFSFREDVHFTWDLALSIGVSGSFRRNPQFEVRSPEGGTAWLLLSRHFMNVKQNSHGCYTEPWLKSAANYGFISLYAFDNDGKRAVLSDGAFVRGVYVDSPNTLIKLELSASKGYTIVVSEQALPALSHNFTLSTFSLESLSIEKAREKYNHRKSRFDAWTLTSSGGNASSIYYHMNPQFNIKVSTTSDVSLLLEAFDNFPVHVKLLWGSGKAVASITTRDIVGDSGEYRKGCALAEICDVQAGAYTIICSTFEQGQQGKFSLHVDTSSSCTVERIPAAEAGLLTLRIPTAYFSLGVDRLLAPLISRRITRVSLLACRSQSRPTPRIESGSLLKLAVEHGQGPSKQVLAVSGDDEFLDCKSGIQTKEVDIHPSMCEHRGLWVVIQRLELLGLQHEEEVDLEILSDGPIEVEAWGTGDG